MNVCWKKPYPSSGPHISTHSSLGTFNRVDILWKIWFCETLNLLSLCTWCKIICLRQRCFPRKNSRQALGFWNLLTVRLKGIVLFWQIWNHEKLWLCEIKKTCCFSLAGQRSPNFSQQGKPHTQFLFDRLRSLDVFNQHLFEVTSRVQALQLASSVQRRAQSRYPSELRFLPTATLLPLISSPTVMDAWQPEEGTWLCFFLIDNWEYLGNNCKPNMTPFNCQTWTPFDQIKKAG